MRLNTPELKVGLFVLVSLSFVLFLSVKLSKNPSVLGSTQGYSFMLDDAGGLIKNTAVKVAGVKVGIISDIRLVQGRAQIDILVQSDLGLTESAIVEIKSNGILGDRFVAIYAGNLTDPPLESGAMIKNVQTAGSLDTVMNEVSKVSSALQEVAAALKQATVDGTDETPIGRIVSNLEKLTADLASVSSENKDSINRIIDSIEQVTDTLKVAFGESGREEFRKAWGNVTGGMEKLDRSLANIEEVTNKINEGEGTIGKLLNDEETVEGINKAIGNLNRVLGGALNLETTFDFKTEYMAEAGEMQTYFGLKIQPGLDRYYYLGIVQDPYGTVKSKTVETTTTTGAPPVSTDSTVREVVNYDNKIKITALFAKNFYNFTLRGGLIQSSGGFGFDYNLFNDSIKLSLEMFDFDDPNLRAFARWDIFKGIYLVGGGDSILDREGREFNPFFGGGIYLTNDDINIFAAQFLR